MPVGVSPSDLTVERYTWVMSDSGKKFVEDHWDGSQRTFPEPWRGYAFFRLKPKTDAEGTNPARGYAVGNAADRGRAATSSAASSGGDVSAVEVKIAVEVQKSPSGTSGEKVGAYLGSAKYPPPVPKKVSTQLPFEARITKQIPAKKPPPLLFPRSLLNPKSMTRPRPQEGVGADGFVRSDGDSEWEAVDSPNR